MQISLFLILLISVNCFGENLKAQLVAEEVDKAWFETCLVGMEWGPTGANAEDPRYMSRANARQIVQETIRARSEYLILFMKDMEFAYYPSKVATPCPSLKDRDFLQECIDEAKKHNLPVLAYEQVQYDGSSWRVHPEWRMQDSQGRDIDRRLCYRSGYLEFIKEVAAELMEYEIVGFHFDMLDFGFGPPYGCWCQHCKKAFQQEFGKPMPVGVTWDEDWDNMLQFRCDSNAGFARQLQSFVKQKRPDISVDFNYHGYPPFTWMPGQRPVQHAQNGDFVTAEGLPFVFGHNNPSLVSLFLGGARLDRRLQIATSRSAWNYHDFTVRPVAEMKWEVMTYLAHGVQCTIVDKANYDGTIDRLVYDRLGEVFSEAQDKRDYFMHPPVAQVGLYYSGRNRDWIGREDSAAYLAAFWGAHRALVQSHITMGIIMDENVSVKRLASFPVVYLPNIGYLSAREIDLLQNYVREGGHLLLTGLSGFYNNLGQLQDHNALCELIGVEPTGQVELHQDNYLKLDGSDSSLLGKSVSKDVPADWPMLVWGPAAGYRATTAKAAGQIMTAFRTPKNQWQDLMSPDKAIGPAILSNQFGKGKVITIPCAVDAAFAGRFRVPEQRNLVRNLICYLQDDPVFRIEAPSNVEVIATRDLSKKRLLLHVLNYSSPPTFAAHNFAQGRQVLPTQMEESLPYEMMIRLNFKPDVVTADNTQTTITAKGNQITVSGSAVHAVISINPF